MNPFKYGSVVSAEDFCPASASGEWSEFIPILPADVVSLSDGQQAACLRADTHRQAGGHGLPFARLEDRLVPP